MASALSQIVYRTGWLVARVDRLFGWYAAHTVQPFIESDDTRCCDNTICPPEDGHVIARNMSRIVM
jgi:hypothetical protein